MTHADKITAIVTFVAALAGGIGGSLIVLWAASRTDKHSQQLANDDRKASAELAKQDREAGAELAKQDREAGAELAKQDREASAALLDRQLKEQALRARKDRRAQALLSANERADRLQDAARERMLDREEQRFSIARTAAAKLLEHISNVNTVLPNMRTLQTAYVEPYVRVACDRFQHGLRTELLLVNDAELVSRYRTLARLVGELAGITAEEDILFNRALCDVTNYAKYVLISLRQFIDEEELVGQTAAPVLRRNPADGSNWFPIEVPVDWDLV